MKYFHKIVFLFLLSGCCPPVVANEPMSSDELEKWFNEDTSDDEARALAVNEGELEFLIRPPSKAVHYSRNILTIDKGPVCNYFRNI